MPFELGIDPATPGDNFTTKEQEKLGRYNVLGLLRYKDLDAAYCRSCGEVFGVECPRCGIKAGQHGFREAVFSTDRPLITSREDGLVWTPVTCLKCDFRFRVMIR